jgi:hypothetical protein
MSNCTSASPKRFFLLLLLFFLFLRFKNQQLLVPLKQQQRTDLIFLFGFLVFFSSSASHRLTEMKHDVRDMRS